MSQQQQSTVPSPVPVAEVVENEPEEEEVDPPSETQFPAQVVVPYFRYEDHVDEFPPMLPCSDLRPNNPRGREAFARRDRMVNILSPAGVRSVMDQLTQTGMLVQQAIRTGHSPSRKNAWVSRFTTARYAAVTPFATGLASQEIGNFWTAYSQRYNNASAGDKELMTKPISHARNYQLQVSHVVWRYTHEFRLLCVGLETSHRAAAYDGFDFGQHRLDSVPSLKGSQFVNGPRPGVTNWLRLSTRGPQASEQFPFLGYIPTPSQRVEEVELESEDVQETRKYCASTFAMWRKGSDGSVIREDEDFTGQTMCPHQIYGKICFGPYPVSGADQVVLAQSGREPPTRNIKSPSEQSARRQTGMPTGGSQTPDKKAAPM